MARIPRVSVRTRDRDKPRFYILGSQLEDLGRVGRFHIGSHSLALRTRESSVYYLELVLEGTVLVYIPHSRLRATPAASIRSRVRRQDSLTRHVRPVTSVFESREKRRGLIGGMGPESEPRFTLRGCHPCGRFTSRQWVMRECVQSSAQAPRLVRDRAIRRETRRQERMH